MRDMQWSIEGVGIIDELVLGKDWVNKGITR
jgi:hypothetical protein